MTPADVAPSPIARPMVPARYRVVTAVRELVDTVTLGLDPLDAAPVPFAPGQFNMVWGFGTGEVPISISGDPTSPSPLLHTIRDVGASTASLCELETGAVVGVRGPFGTSWDLDAAHGSDVVVIAGGIGLAPLRPTLWRILAARHRFRRVIVLVGARSPDRLLYGDQLEHWSHAGQVEVLLTVDHATRGWRGNVGVVTELLQRVDIDPNATFGMVCGPEIMIRFAATALADRGVPANRVQVSLERNMKCAVAHCGHCQLGPTLICRDGPVYSYDVVGPLMAVRGL